MSKFGFASRIKVAAKSVTRKQWTTTAVVIAVIAVAIIAFSLRPTPDPLDSAEIAAVKDRGVLRVGIRNDVPSFGGVDGDGNPAGFEVDLANALAARIFGTSQIEFTVVNFNTMTAKLRDGQLDCAIAIAQKDMSTALTYSESYYTDAAAIMVALDSTVQSFSDLAGMTIGCVNRDGSNMRYSVRNALNTFASAQTPVCTVKEFASSADMLRELADGHLGAVCLEYSLLYSFYSTESHRILPDALGTISYAVACPPDSGAVASVATAMIDEMKADGSLTELLAKWGLRDYSD